MPRSLTAALLTIFFGAFAAPGLVPATGAWAASANGETPDTGSGVPPAYEGALKSLAALNVRDAVLETRLDGLARPWAFEFVDATRVLITELHGRLLVADLETGSTTGITGVPEFVTGHEQTGLLDVALYPDFAQSRRIVFSYVEADPGTGRYYTPVIAAGRLADDQLVDRVTLLRVTPYGWSPSNFGGALAFGPDGRLYVSIGDRSEDGLAQRGDRLEGKILRLEPDGGTPPDNPFVDDPAVDDRVFALGVRNVQGLVFDPGTGQLYAAEHGPLGGDEINRIVAGANYGWPVITYGRNYSTAPMGEGTHREGMQQPLFYYLPSEAISPLEIYQGAMFDEWQGDLLVGALKGRHVSKLDLDGDVVRSEYPLLGELGARVRDIKAHPDGSIYVLLQNGALVRLFRDGSAPAPATGGAPGEIYALVCAGCHDTGAESAPGLDESARWKLIDQQPREAIYRRVIEGFGAMPARGLCNLCTDDHLRATVDYMLERGAATQ